jgi:hypothetical protein
MKLLLLPFILVLCSFTLADDPPKRVKLLSGPAVATGPVLREVWVNRTNPQGRLGWLQTLSYTIDENGTKLIRTVSRDHMRYLRSGDPYSEESEQYTIETEAGDVIEVGYRTNLGKHQDLVIRGRPKGNTIVLEVLDHAGKNVVYTQEKPWDPKAKGMLAQDRYLEGQTDWTPGKTYTIHGFLQTLNAVAPATFTVLGRKKMTIDGVEKEFIELEQSYPKELFLDKSKHYLDPKTGESWITTEDSSLFDLVSHTRCTKAQALEPFAGTVKDRDAPVTIDKPLPINLWGLPGNLRVEVEMSEDDSPEAVFVDSPRQKFVRKNGKRSEFRLSTKPFESKEEPAPGKEYLESNFYVRSNDATVKKLAEEAVRDATEPDQKMARISRWVRKNVKGDYEVGFATADEVARTLEGDCTEMGILAAAMGRSLGIPTRVCFGIVYDPDNPGFGGHLWTEAYIGDRWKTYDPTGVIDALGAAYLRIDGYSMAGVLGPDEFVGVRRGFAGRMKVFLLEAK